MQAAFIEAACAYGLAYVADDNRPGAVGAGPIPRNARAGVRMGTALTCLAAARGRPNGGCGRRPGEHDGDVNGPEADRFKREV